MHIKRKITSSTVIFSLINSCSGRSSINSTVSRNSFLISSSTFMAILILFFSIFFGVCCVTYQCALDFNLEISSCLYFAVTSTPSLIRLLNIVMKRCDWLLIVVARFFDYLVVVQFFPSTILQLLGFSLRLMYKLVVVQYSEASSIAK